MSIETIQTEMPDVIAALQQAMQSAIQYYIDSTPAPEWQIASTIAALLAAIIAAITAVIMFLSTRATLDRMREQTESAVAAANATIEEMKRQTSGAEIASKEEARSVSETYLSERWDQVFSECVQHPELLDAAQIESFYDGGPALEGEQYPSEQERQLRYAAFCYRLWNLVNEVVRRNFQHDFRFQALINWAKELHEEWLVRNPDFFTSSEFWEVVTAPDSTPHMIVRYKPLPTIPHHANTPQQPHPEVVTEGSKDKDITQREPLENSLRQDLRCTSGMRDIDWAYIAPRYTQYILSPFDASMLETQNPRNPLVTAIRTKVERVARKASVERSGRGQVSIVEFGCGPGTLVKALKAAEIQKIERLVFVDQNAGVLQFAVSAAKESGIELGKVEAFVGDMASFAVPPEVGPSLCSQFDIIVCANAILSTDRAQVEQTLINLKRHMKRDGEIELIFPSFDTTEYLENLWVAKAYHEVGEAHARRVRVAFQKNKCKKPAAQCVAFADQVFADDGRTRQGYHTPQSIIKEMSSAEMEVVRSNLIEVFYPWKLTRRFDYGNFDNPEALLNELPPSLIEKSFWDGNPRHEIWDWFVCYRAH